MTLHMLQRNHTLHLRNRWLKPRFSRVAAEPRIISEEELVVVRVDASHAAIKAQTSSGMKLTGTYGMQPSFALIENSCCPQSLARNTSAPAAMPRAQHPCFSSFGNRYARASNCKNATCGEITIPYNSECFWPSVPSSYQATYCIRL